MADPHLRAFFAVGGGSALALLLSLLTATLVARLLGAAAFGQWTLIVAAGTLLSSLLNWSQSSMVRFGCEEWLTHRTLGRTLGARLPLLASGAAVVLVMLVAQPGQWLQRWFGVDGTHWWLAGLYAASLWLAAEAQATFRASERVQTQGWLAPLARGVAAAALVPLFWVGGASITTVTLLLTVPAISVWVAAWAVALRGGRVDAGALRPHDVWRHLRYGWPVLPTFAVGYLSDWGDHLLLRVFASVSDVGVFGLAYQVFAGLLAANSLFTTVLLPRLIAGHMESPDTTALYVRHVVPTLLTLWIVVSIWLVVFAPAAVAAMGGGSFAGATQVIAVLCVALPASVITHLYGVLLDVQHRLNTHLSFVIALTATNLLLSVVLIPVLGALGAAVGTAVSYLAGQWLYVRDQHRRTGIPRTAALSLWAIGAAAGLLQVTIADSLPARVVWGLAATGAVAVVARRVRAVNSDVLARILSGPLSPVAPAVTRALVTPAL